VAHLLSEYVMPILFPVSAALASFYLNSLCHGFNLSFDACDNALRWRNTQNLGGDLDLPIIILSTSALLPSQPADNVNP
jgi:hypothetical protein